MENIKYTYKLEWRGITIKICFEPDCTGGIYTSVYGYPLAHLTLESIEPEKAPLPMTNTGFISDFFAASEMDGYDSTISYVQHWLDETAKSSEWTELQEKSKQMSFF